MMACLVVVGAGVDAIEKYERRSWNVDGTKFEDVDLACERDSNARCEVVSVNDDAVCLTDVEFVFGEESSQEGADRDRVDLVAAVTGLLADVASVEGAIVLRREGTLASARVSSCCGLAGTNSLSLEHLLSAGSGNAIAQSAFRTSS
jgi:hypothetical protein